MWMCEQCSAVEGDANEHDTKKKKREEKRGDEAEHVEGQRRDKDGVKSITRNKMMAKMMQQTDKKQG